jgi:hypothetical protein
LTATPCGPTQWKPSVINLHQGTVLVPYISYLANDTVKQMAKFVAEAHARELRVKAHLGFYPTATFQYSSTTLYQFSYHIQ